MTVAVGARPYTPSRYAALAEPARDPRIPTLGRPHLDGFTLHAGIPVIALGGHDELLMAPGHHDLDAVATAFNAHINADRWAWLGGDIQDGTVRHAYACLSAPQSGEPWAVDTRAAPNIPGAFPVTLWTPNSEPEDTP